MNLELKVMGALKEEKELREPDEGLRITRGAFEKAMLYARLVSEIAGSGMECYGYLLKPKDSLEDVVTDVYLGDGQDALSAHVYLSDEGVKQAMDEVEPMGYQIIGWWHSHGTMGTFHSGWDKENFLTVLHSIAPRTMYRLEEVDVSREDGDIHFDEYKVKGVSQDTPVTVLKRIERDPFAYSMVVNVYTDTYIECQRKNFDEEKGRFSVRAPNNPGKEVVAGDCSLDVPEMEWEIYEKVRMQGNSREEPIPVGHDYSEIEELALQKAKQSLMKRNRYEGVVREMVQSGKGGFQLLLDAQQERLGNEERRDVLDAENSYITEPLDGVPPETLYSDTTVLTKANLERRLYLDFLDEFMSVNKPERVIREYQQKARELKEAEDTAEAAVKTLTRYAMEKHTNYSSDGPSYGDYVAGVLTEYLSGGGLDECLENPSQQPSEFFLIKDRIRIFNSLLNDVYSERSRHTDFLKEFPEAYDAGNADACIQEYLGGYAPGRFNGVRVNFQRPSYTASQKPTYAAAADTARDTEELDVEEIREELNTEEPKRTFWDIFSRIRRGFL